MSIRDATFTPSIKNDGRVAVQVDEEIEQPFRGFLKIKLNSSSTTYNRYYVTCFPGQPPTRYAVALSCNGRLVAFIS